uniref:ATP synthase complex subunit 8 n=1 Tax=Trigoniophthalmus alternatus TaxID=50637 RepID=B2BSA2_9INSE|nr:ATP synthase F0 subunit 8 [Trigoniophthalmus alternatus]ABS57555.1 ATP synthase F0 subunit 8 [Trigoniophthalmus alternatus]
MPQMSPLNWILLFTLFLSTYITFLVINYFNLSKKSIQPVESNQLMNNYMNWKW